MNDRNEVRELMELILRLAPSGPAEELNPETRLFANRILDSMNILDLVGYLENRLGRKLQSKELVMENFSSVQKIVEVFLLQNDE